MSAFFARRLSREMLDLLPCDDPRAVRSRLDIHRLNDIMGSARLIARAMRQHAASSLQHRDEQPLRLIDLGCGDATLTLGLARRLAGQWPATRLTLLDRHDVVRSDTRDELARHGWHAETLSMDIGDWTTRADLHSRWDMAVANLFIHHLDTAQIKALFGALARRTDWFMACEPQRGPLPLLASRGVGLTGAGAVTRNDAILSVQAGFRDFELSGLWPAARADWALQESSRLISHTFTAFRKPSAQP